MNRTWVRSILCLLSLATLGACSQDSERESGVLATSDAQQVDAKIKTDAVPTAQASEMDLENTYWKLMSLGSDSVTVAAEREPYLVLHSQDKRVAGYGGCNRIMGTYALSGQQLTFSQMAGTRMACPDNMQYEQALHDALAKVSQWRIEGETLELSDASGASLALFEARHMR